MDGEHSANLLHRLFGAALLVQHGCEFSMSNVVVLGQRDRAYPEGLCVVPVMHLPIGKDPKQEDANHGGNGQPSLGDPVRACQVGDQPYDHYKQADERDVGIAIGHRLLTHLHQPDHRHQGAQEPEPSNREITLLARAQNDCSADQQQFQRRRPHLPGRIKLAGMRIHGDQFCGPERLAQIAHVRDHRRFQPHGQAVTGKGSNRASGLLGLHRDDGAGGRQQEEGHLFQRQPSYRFECSFAARG